MGMKVGNDDSTTRTRILALDFLQVDSEYICAYLYTVLSNYGISMWKVLIEMCFRHDMVGLNI